MSKQSPQPSSQPTHDTTRLVVCGERRKEPDWDTYIAALLAYALREVEGDGDAPQGADDD
jgi:hypothetical protein